MAYTQASRIVNYLYKGSLVLLLVVYSDHKCLANVLQQRWRSPCSGSTSSSIDFQMSAPSLRPISRLRVAHRLWQSASNVREAIQRLRNKYFQERIQSGDLQTLLHGNTTLHGFPDPRPLNSTMSFGTRLAEDFRRVSVVAVFIEQMKRDEEQSTMSPSYATDYERLESHIYPFLCLLDVAVRTQPVSISVEYVGRDVMLHSDRVVTSTALRYSRDYKVLNDCDLLFGSVQTDYEILTSVRYIITSKKRNKA